MQNTLPIVIFLPIQSAIVPNAKLPTNMPAMYTLWAKDFFHWSSQTMPKSMVAVEVNTPVSATHPWVHFSVSVSEYWSSWHVDSTDLFSRLNKEGVGWRSIYWEEIFQNLCCDWFREWGLQAFEIPGTRYTITLSVFFFNFSWLTLWYVGWFSYELTSHIFWHFLSFQILFIFEKRGCVSLFTFRQEVASSLFTFRISKTLNSQFKICCYSVQSVQLEFLNWW